MQRIAFILCLLFTIPLSLSAQLIAPGQSSDTTNTCSHSRKKTCTSLSPTLRIVLNPCNISQESAVSFLGEFGVRNLRLNGTVGMNLFKDNRLKVSVDYLKQQLGYNFSSGNTHQTINQFAIGGTYEYYLDCWKIANVEATLFYSRAKGHTLSNVTCVSPSSTLSRHIAGGRDYGLSFGGYMLPWQCAKAGVFVYYDFVMYRKKFSTDRVVQGPGIGFSFGQKLYYNLEYDCRAEFRTPFLYYFGLLNWNSNYLRRYGDLKIGIFGSYTSGNSGLPDCSCIGVQLSFNFGCCNPCLSTSNCNNPCTQSCYKSCPTLCDWTEIPAVYVPEVLAITEQN